LAVKKDDKVIFFSSSMKPGLLREAIPEEKAGPV
jgi:hypothetical protein